jgi:riboflavin biosynthesis pyrimidine reductase
MRARARQNFGASASPARLLCCDTLLVVIALLSSLIQCKHNINIMVSSSSTRSRARLHRARCLVSLLTSLTCLHYQTILGESAVSVKLDSPLVQEVIKSLQDVKADTKDESNHSDSEELSTSDAAAIKAITSQISSWMDMKRQHDLSKTQAKLFEDRVHTRHRPFVTLAYAQTLDGMIAAKIANDDSVQTTSNLQLSCPQSFILTHKLRNMHDAILVGGSTFLIDAPRLNVRLPSSVMRESLIEQPIPVVLDTNLNSLQKLLWGKVIPNPEVDEEETNNEMPQDMHPENIRASNPILCCSSDAAKLFLDHLESFQQNQQPVKKVDEFPGQLNRQQKRVYRITVYKMVDDENDHEEDMYLPIKITVQVTLEGNKVDAETVTTTFTLLPCQLHQNEETLDLLNVLQQLNRRFQIDSVMVEGGAKILSSFINECVGSRKDKKSGKNFSWKLADCICASISPSIIGKKGLHALRELDVTNQKRSHDEMHVTPMSLRDGQFLSLGRDCLFLGRL